MKEDVFFEDVFLNPAPYLKGVFFMSEYKYQHGLSIMRAQPFHIGHARLIDRMLRECEKVTIILGSIQEQGTERNPLNYTTRKK